MSKLLPRLIIPALAVFLLLWLMPQRPIRHAPGVLVNADPAQTEPKTPKVWTYKGYHLTALAQYDIDAVVLSRARYYMGRECDISPLDLALGWKCMSDQAVIDKLSVSQNGRWYEYTWSGAPPVTENEIACHSANTHIVPATDAVRAQLLAIRPGNLVSLHGNLISADSSDGWRWVSSLSRYDSGSGSCELMWVESMEVK